MTMKELASRRALVCGASAGIGRAVALDLAKRGAHVVLLARRADRLKALRDEIGAGGGLADVLVADLDDRAALGHEVDRLLCEDCAIHILINNAGGPEAGALLEADSEAFERGVGRHVLASQQLVKALLPGMVQAGFGRIINIISTSVREPIANLGVSNTIRGAMAAWAKTLSHELPPGVTINNVLPGLTQTERLDVLRRATAARLSKSSQEVDATWLAMVPEKRFADPQEIAAAVGFLASPMAGYIRGVSLPVDGGRLRSI